MPVIQHVTRVVTIAQIEPCISFYEILGFRRTAVPAGISGRATWLEEGSAPFQIHLTTAHDARPDPGHFALLCPDYDSTLERLRAAGHEVDRRREHWGAPRAYVRDPAGNLVELMAWAPGRTPPGTQSATSDGGAR